MFVIATVCQNAALYFACSFEFDVSGVVNADEKIKEKKRALLHYFHKCLLRFLGCKKQNKKETG